MIKNYHDICENIYFFFVCGESSISGKPKKLENGDFYVEEIKSGEIAIYRYCDYLKVKNKTNITINIYKSREHYFSLHTEKSRDNIIKSKRNNIEKKISDIVII